MSGLRERAKEREREREREEEEEEEGSRSVGSPTEGRKESEGARNIWRRRGRMKESRREINRDFYLCIPPRS